MSEPRIVFSLAQIPAAEPGQRVLRSVQSVAAERLASALRARFGEPGRQSRAHSRNMVAAAAGRARNLYLGVDVEWEGDNRNIAGLTRVLLPSGTAALGRAEFYRAWTFYEAYFKAFQRSPAESDIVDISAGLTGQRALSSGVGVLQMGHGPGFQFCLVWQSEEKAPLSPVFVPVADDPMNDSNN